MKPIPRVKVSVQCVKSNSKVRKGKEGKSDLPAANSTHKREHDADPGTGKKLRGESKEMKQFKCFQCFQLIEHDSYMKHLIDHDKKRRAESNQQQQEPMLTPAEAVQEEIKKCRQQEMERRRVLYQYLGVPKRYYEDAILVCPGCRGKLYFTMDDFCKHCLSCDKYNQLKEMFGLKI